MGIEEKLTRALKYEEGMRRTYKKYLEDDLMPEVKNMFRELLLSKERDIRKLKEAKRKFCAG